MPDPRRPRTFGRSRPAGAAARSGGSDRRRSGPPDEAPWWDPTDQSLAEAVLLDRRALGRGWRPAPMVNNVERARSLGSDPASDRIEAARAARRLTGLDEGRAWRHRNAGSLIVVRSEVYADDDPGAAVHHRSAWAAHAEAALDATWRERWRERDRDPAWIEARWVRPGDDPGDEERPTLGPACDWLRIEDHTTAVGGTRQGRPTPVTAYEHLTVWGGRRQVTVVVRHDIGLDLDDVVARCGAAVERHVGA